MTYTTRYLNYTITDECKEDAGGWYPCCVVKNNATGESQSIAVRLIVGSHKEAIRAALLNTTNLIRSGGVGF